jgi:hypothetical protein
MFNAMQVKSEKSLIVLVATYIYKEIEAMCKGQEFELPTRMKNNGQIALSSTVRNVEEYVEKIQENICGWYISL